LARDCPSIWLAIGTAVGVSLLRLRLTRA